MINLNFCRQWARLASVLLSFVFGSAAVYGQDISGAWNGKLKVGIQELTMVLHIDSSKHEVTMAVIEQGGVDMPMEVEYLREDSLCATLPKNAIRIMGRMSDGVLKSVFSQGLMSFKIDFDRGEPTFNRPQTPMPPYPYRTEEVTFTNPSAQVTLAGTLTYPVGYKKKKHPPVVLMVTGSGPENRDEEMFYHRPFLVLADWLARHGIASLRYDDRGVGQSTGQHSEATTQDFADDAEAGLTYLKGMGRFSKVGILGHSEGGGIAYMLGSKGIPDFIVSMAGPACKIDTMMMVQLNLISRSQGATADVVQTPQAARIYMKMTGGGKWMDYFLDWNVEPYVSATRCPVMALGGENDLNVPPSINHEALMRCLPDHAQNLVKVYPGLSHLFHHNPTGNPMKAAFIEETIAPEVLTDIATWINQLK